MPVDENTPNPLFRYGDVVTLADVSAGARILTYDFDKKSMSYAILTSSWTQQVHDMDIRPVAVGYVIPKPSGKARNRRELIFLDDAGVCPYPDGQWNRHAFSVFATERHARMLDTWMKAHVGRSLANVLWSSGLMTSVWDVPKKYKGDFLDFTAPFRDERPWLIP